MLDQESEKQKELFEEFQKPQKKLIFFKNNNRHLQNRIFLWQLSTEKIVFLSMGIILSAVITFSLGVERGKRLVLKERVAAILPAAQPVGKTKTSATYTIMAASCLKEDDAQKDAVKLKKAGFPVYITQSGKFFVIKVGDFNDKEQADAVLSALKKNHGYTDIYIKTNK